MTKQITNHSRKRCKERLGLSKKDTDKIAEKALQRGIHYNETKGSLKRYLSYVYSYNKTANNIIIYNRNIFIFIDVKLITIFHLPNQYVVIYDKLQKNKNERLKLKMS